jgi:hypothetical protein
LGSFFALFAIWSGVRAVCTVNSLGIPELLNKFSLEY